MQDELLPYYERELTFLRQMGGEFAAKYPKIASRLLLEKDKCEDPHVERLIQAFAFLAGRIHRKLDDELPEVSDSLLSVLYPHYLAPIPSMAIVQFILDHQRVKLTTGHRIEKGTVLYSQPVNDTACRFRTCFPVTLWPIQLTSAVLESPEKYGQIRSAASVIRLEFRCTGAAKLKTLGLDHLQVYLHGESQLAYALYELLLNDTCEVQLRSLGEQDQKVITLSQECLKPGGFSPEEGILPYSPRSFQGYRLLQEYFAFPEKFLFVDFTELDRAGQAGFEDGFQVLVFLRRVPRLEQQINATAFRVGCTPVVNLFEQVAEPIRLNHVQTEYQVIPDVRRHRCLEVYSIDKVVSTSSQQEEPIQFQPFYSFTHGAPPRGQATYWHAARRPSAQKGDPGTEVYLSLVGLDYEPTLPPVEALTIHTTCTNRDLPAKLPFGGDRGDFELEGAAALSRIRCLTKPTEPIRPPQRHGAQWRLISSLSLNYLSIVEFSREALQELLRLYNFADSSVIRQQIAGIVSVTSRRVTARSPHRVDFSEYGENNGRRVMPWNGFCRGIEVTIEFDETKYVGSGLFVFASVLERFLALYASLNSFTQMTARTQQREEALRQWPPRAGEQILL